VTVGRVVVGVDGSPGSRAALAYAVDEARRRGARLRVVGAWHVPAPVSMVVMFPAQLREDLARACRSAVEEAVAALDTVEGVKIEIAVHERPAAAVLLKESRAADVLVVGSRGLGGFRGMLLGSVSQACVHHASCPVVVVPPDARTAVTHAA